MAALPLRFGFLVFPALTQLDMTAPYEVLARIPGNEPHLIWKKAGPIRSEHGLTLQATTSFAVCPRLDLICVPGGPGINALLTDDEVLGFLRQAAAGASLRFAPARLCLEPPGFCRAGLPRRIGCGARCWSSSERHQLLSGSWQTAI
jgi:hypothetical protein